MALKVLIFDITCVIAFWALKVYEIVIFVPKLVKIALTTLNLLYYMSVLVKVPF